jgi:hypothetical protein
MTADHHQNHLPFRRRAPRCYMRAQSISADRSDSESDAVLLALSMGAVVATFLLAYLSGGG